MCIIGTVAVSTMAPVPPASSSSSALVQIMKPKLPRKITRTPKINLNKYWSLFENIMAETATAADAASGRTLAINEFEDTEMNNEINENISNEEREINEILVRRNNERNSMQSQRCTCPFCLISDLRNVTVSERNEQVTEL